MALTTAVARASASSTTTSTTLVASITPTSITGGSFVVVCIAADNAGTAGVSPITSVTDSAGTTYTSRVATVRNPSSTANTGAAVAIFTGRPARTLVAGTDTITVNLSPTTVSKAVRIFEVRTSTPTTTYVDFGAAQTAASGNSTAAATTANFTTTTGRSLIGAVSYETNATLTLDSDTVGGLAWSSVPVVAANTGTAGTSITLAAQDKGPLTVGATTHQYNITSASAANWAAVVINVLEATTPSGSAAVTLGAATMAASGSVSSTPSGSMATTLAAATFAAAGVPTVGGAFASTLAGATLASTATPIAVGAIAATLTDATLSASGTTGSNPSGTLASTLSDATLGATGTPVARGTIAGTLQAAILAANGTPIAAGAISRTLAAATFSGTGSGADATGSMAVALVAATLSATGTGANPTGTLASTLAAATLSGTGDVGGVPTGSIAGLLAAATLNGAGYTTSFATMAGSLQPATFDASANVIGATPSVPPQAGPRKQGKVRGRHTTTVRAAPPTLQGRIQIPEMRQVVTPILAFDLATDDEVLMLLA